MFNGINIIFCYVYKISNVNFIFQLNESDKKSVLERLADLEDQKKA